MKTKIVVRKIHSPLSIRARALNYANRPYPEEVDKGLYGATVGNLTEAVRTAMGLSKENLRNRGKDEKLTSNQKDQIEGSARLVISWLFMDGTETFEPTSRGDLTAQQINALNKWMSEYVGVYPDGEWQERRMFKDELTWILFSATRAYKMTTDALSIGDEILFADILEKMTEEIEQGRDLPDSWDKYEFEPPKMEAQAVLTENTPAPLPEKDVAPVTNASAFEGLPF